MATHFSILVRTSLVAQTVKRLPTMWESWVQSLDQEDLLEKEMATHSSILAGKIPCREESGGLQSMGSQKSQTQLSNLAAAILTLLPTTDPNSTSGTAQTSIKCPPYLAFVWQSRKSLDSMF